MSEKSVEGAENDEVRGGIASTAAGSPVDAADAAEAASRAARRSFEADAYEAASREEARRRPVSGCPVADPCATVAMAAMGKLADAGEPAAPDANAPAAPADTPAKPLDEAAEEALESLSDLSGVAAMSAQISSDLAADDAAYASRAMADARRADAEAAAEKTSLLSDRAVNGSLTRQLPGHASVPHVEETIIMQRAGKMPQRLSQVPKDRRPGRRRMAAWKKALIVIAVLAVAGGAGYTDYTWYQTHEAAQAEKKPVAGAMQEVRISVKISGLATAEDKHYDAVGSKIPVQVSGQDASGSIVDQVGYVDEHGRGLRLLPGEYELSAAASPIAADGTVYIVPTTRLSVTVQTGTRDYTGAGSLRFEIPSAGAVTDSQIADAYKYASEGGAPSEAIAKILQQAAAARRDAATKAAGNQAAELQNEANRRHKATTAYSFDLPASWYGKVYTAQNGNTVYVYLAKTQTLVCMLTLEKDGAAAPANALTELGSKSLGNGTSVVVRGSVYPQLIPQVASGKVAGQKIDTYPEKDAVELVRLQTGNTYTFEQIKRGIAGEKADGAAVTKIVQDYLAKELVASIQAA